MRLFCFASRSVENIERGIAAKKWAVATVSDSAMKSRKTKAANNLRSGDFGLLYCNPTHSFTTPFIIASEVDCTGVVVDIWPEPWVLPFSIRPLGGLDRQMPQAEAQERWPLVKRRMGEQGGVPAAMNITGTTVFVPVEISAEDWRLVLNDLALPGS